MLELVAARAFPGAAYQRTAIIAVPVSVGRPHPELMPRLVRSLEPEVERFHAQLAETGEPEVPAFMSDTLRRRLAAGHELWIFHAGGRIAHAKWVVSDQLRFAGVSLPLKRNERVLEAGVTLPEFRAQGLNGRAREHVAMVLGQRGVTRAMGAINGFNRRLLATSLRWPGAQQVAMVHTVSLGSRRWLRAAPASLDGTALLEHRGLPTGRWVRAPSVPREDLPRRWDRAAATALSRPYLDSQMARVKREAHLLLLDRWLPDLEGKSLLKTDLWEEGVTGDELLFSLARRAGSAHGIDISSTTIASASRAAADNAVAVGLTRADVRELPFADGEIDAVVSTSTLDHLPEADREKALAEIRRVLSAAGVLVITADNRENVGDRLLRATRRLGVLPFPLESSLTLADLQKLVRRAGFVPEDHAYLVHGPRVLTTACVRGMRMLPARWSTRAIDQLLGALDATGRRTPARMSAFVALLARPADQPASAA